jgi:hypothetical protein
LNSKVRFLAPPLTPQEFAMETFTPVYPLHKPRPAVASKSVLSPEHHMYVVDIIEDVLTGLRFTHAKKLWRVYDAIVDRTLTVHVHAESLDKENSVEFNLPSFMDICSKPYTPHILRLSAFERVEYQIRLGVLFSFTGLEVPGVRCLYPDGSIAEFVAGCSAEQQNLRNRILGDYNYSEAGSLEHFNDCCRDYLFYCIRAKHSLRLTDETYGDFIMTNSLKPN